MDTETDDYEAMVDRMRQAIPRASIPLPAWRFRDVAAAVIGAIIGFGLWLLLSQ